MKHRRRKNLLSSPTCQIFVHRKTLRQNPLAKAWAMRHFDRIRFGPDIPIGTIELRSMGLLLAIIDASTGEISMLD